MALRSRSRCSSSTCTASPRQPFSRCAASETRSPPRNVAAWVRSLAATTLPHVAFTSPPYAYLRYAAASRRVRRQSLVANNPSRHRCFTSPLMHPYHLHDHRVSACLHSPRPRHTWQVGGCCLHALSFQQARNWNMPPGGVHASFAGYMLTNAGVPCRAILRELNSVRW